MVDCVGGVIAGASEPAVRLVAARVAASTQNEGARKFPPAAIWRHPMPSASSTCASAAQSVMLRNHDPKIALEAKFGLKFAMASEMVARRVGLAELDDASRAAPT